MIWIIFTFLFDQSFDNIARSVIPSQSLTIYCHLSEACSFFRIKKLYRIIFAFQEYVEYLVITDNNLSLWNIMVVDSALYSVTM